MPLGTLGGRLWGSICSGTSRKLDCVVAGCLAGWLEDSFVTQGLGVCLSGCSFMLVRAELGVKCQDDFKYMGAGHLLLLLFRKEAGLLWISFPSSKAQDLFCFTYH